jgi:uncharacterized protein (DUF3084 family)
VLATRAAELEASERALAERLADVERREGELTTSARTESERVSDLIAARSAELEQREAAIKDRETDVENRERKLRRAAEGTVAALLGEGADQAAATPQSEPQPELTFSEGMQALAQRRRR